jgi:hypothetical protein
METRCSSCGLVGIETPYEGFLDLPICKSCWELKSTNCRRCGERYIQDAMFRVLGATGLYCKNCVTAFKLCNICGNWYTINSPIINVCRDCFEANYRSCNDCFGYFFINVDCVPYGGHYLCHACHSKINAIHAYNFKPTSYVIHGDDDKLTMGVEVEVEMEKSVKRESSALDFRNTFSPDEKLLYIKHDGTVSHGWEMVTQPCTLKFHEKAFPWTEILTWFRDKKAQSSNLNTCGLHVHAGKSFFTNTDMIKVALMLHGNVDIMTLISRRAGVTHAKYKKLINRKLDLSYNKDRYEVVNFQNKFSVEFRSFRGTINYNNLIATLQFVHSFSRFIKTISTVHVLDGKYSWNEYLKFVRDNGRRYSALIDYLCTREFYHINKSLMYTPPTLKKEKQFTLSTRRATLELEL